MASRGIEQVFVYGVDNILVRICDPVMLGFAHEKHADCTTKVTPKVRNASIYGDCAYGN